MTTPSLTSALQVLQCGTLAIDFSVLINDSEQRAASWESVFNSDGTTGHLSGISDGQFRDEIYFEFHQDHLRCRRTFTNLGKEPLRLNELKAEITGISFGGARRDDFFYHIENPRIYEVLTFPIDYNRTADDAMNSTYDVRAGNRWADPGVVCDRIGRSPYQPFPALLVGNYHRPNGIVFGTLSQRQCYHNFLLKHAEDNTVTCSAFSSFKGLAYREVAPGETITDWWYLGYVADVANIETIFNGYTKVLREILPPMYGATDINRTSLVWGSWNDGIWRNVSEEMLLREARFLKKNFPAVRWIQLDDGYSRSMDDIAHGLGVVYEGEEGIDYDKFPQGLRHYTNALRELGLRPAIWIGGFCPVKSKIFREHPEWFIDYSYRCKNTEPLDVSQAVVRQYIQTALDTLITEYGFEAVKHDFWSYAFEDSHDLLKEKHHSGYEWRTWWIKEMRKRLPSDGYLQTGCDIVMGNPFLGELFTNYRYGIDIGTGDWNYVRTNFLWGAACFATHTSDLFVPNSDSIGLFPGLNDTEAQFCNTYCLVTHTMVEIAGKLSQCDQSSKRYKMLKKCACNPNNGQEIFYTGWNYLENKENYPRVIYFKTPFFCLKENAPGLPLRTAGLFNLEDEPQEISFTAESMGLCPEKTYTVIDVWTGDITQFQGRYSATVPPHGSQLIAISDIAENGPVALLDADMRIADAGVDGDTFVLTTDYAYTGTLTFSRPVSAVVINGKALPDVQGQQILTLDLPEKATLRIK